MSKLAVIITCHNDFDELRHTVASIRDTAGDEPEIIVIDDGSNRPVEQFSQSIRIIRNDRRIGVGPSRHIGVMATRRDYVLLVDSHMRFQPGWYSALQSRCGQHSKSIICCVCLGLNNKRMDINNPDGIYHGATINVYGADQHARNRNGRPQVFEAIWNRNGHYDDDSEILACMGASYAFNRSWFGYIDPLRFLRGWGEDEIMLSVKSWLCGGDVRLHTGVRIGHKFRLQNDRVPFRVGFDERGHNKLFAILTLLPPDLQSKLMLAFNRLPNSRYGWNVIKANWHTVLGERARNQAMFERDFHWLAQKFGLKLP